MTPWRQWVLQRDEFFRMSPHSPLTPEQKRHFEGLKYFPENPSLRLELKPEWMPEGDWVQIQTNTGQVQSYERYARVRFEVDGEPAELTIFRNEHGLFLPFADALAGVETYGAGRYMDPEELPDGRLRVDFNYAYNPYCAYNENWSCPLTPAENRVQVPIRAGERIFEER
ncbi:MAG TPA: DUF1684 domain-containing protein [Chloroflexi bacterium]|nr:DUF1684 domain-containing protein [Chloroflexota bacterium]